jgi:enterochelin esterase-like enzyme
MNYINPPEKSPQNVFHKTFFCKLYNHELGFNIYLPPDYLKSGERYPVTFHFHGWTGNESSEIWTMERVYKKRNAITIFPNSSPVIEDLENLPVQQMIIEELIPYIDAQYSTDATREGRSVSGFSMGGGFSFYLAAKYPELFSSVTAYAGTYHHYYHSEYRGVGEPVDKAEEMYNDMIRDKRYLEEGNILYHVKQNADMIREGLDISMHVGTDDVLICDNEIMHLYLNSLNIPHEYKKFEGAGHELAKIL